MKDYGLPTFVNRLTPVVELAWSSPASQPSNWDADAISLWGMGVNYTATTMRPLAWRCWSPATGDSGYHPGVIAQFHLYFDDLFPHSLGKPIVEWFET